MPLGSGRNSENVRLAIDTVGPFGIDLCFGVEVNTRQERSPKNECADLPFESAVLRAHYFRNMISSYAGLPAG
jgi:hypothetical protein